MTGRHERTTPSTMSDGHPTTCQLDALLAEKAAARIRPILALELSSLVALPRRPSSKAIYRCSFGQRQSSFISQPASVGPRWTTTGQWAWATQCWLTEPSTIPAKAPWPRWPTTSRSAPSERDTSSSAGCPSRTWALTSTEGWSRSIPSRDCSSMSRASLAGSKPSGKGIGHPYVGHCQAVTASSTAPVRSACSAAQRRAASEARDPSTPATIRDVGMLWRLEHRRRQWTGSSFLARSPEPERRSHAIRGDVANVWKRLHEPH